MENLQDDNIPHAKRCSCMSSLWKYDTMHLKLVAVIIVLIIIALIIFVVTIVLLTSSPDPSTSSTSSPNEEIRVYSREEWSALPPKSDVVDLKLPVQMVIIAHTGEPENCTKPNECFQYIRAIQKHLMNPPKCLSDIPYNFLIGGDGNAYEGRGWYKQGEHTKFYNNRSIGIGFIGNYTAVVPSQQQSRVAQILIQEGVSLKVIVPDYKLYGACQLKNTDSPGAALLKIISKWPHWTKNDKTFCEN